MSTEYRTLTFWGVPGEVYREGMPRQTWRQMTLGLCSIVFQYFSLLRFNLCLYNLDRRTDISLCRLLPFWSFRLGSALESPWHWSSVSLPLIFEGRVFMRPAVVSLYRLWNHLPSCWILKFAMSQPSISTDSTTCCCWKDWRPESLTDTISPWKVWNLTENKEIIELDRIHFLFVIPGIHVHVLLLLLCSIQCECVFLPLDEAR